MLEKLKGTIEIEKSKLILLCLFSYILGLMGMVIVKIFG